MSVGVTLRTVLLGLLAGLPAPLPATAAGDAGGALSERIDPAEALEAYVSREDPSYSWRVRREGEVAGVPFTELPLTSQTWRGIPWLHQLFVMWPETMPEDVDHAFLFVFSGRWSDELDDLEHHPELPRRAHYFALVAELLETPFAVVRHVPFQPLFDGLTEHTLISAWIAHSPTRDFREAEWTSRPCEADGEEFACELARPAEGSAALFGELTYSGRHEELPLRLSTQVRILRAAGSP